MSFDRIDGMNGISGGSPFAWRTLASWRFLLLLGTPVAAAEAQPYPHTITGRIVVEGEVPLAKPLGPGKDECCQLAKPVDQSVLVGPDGGLANVVVTVETRRGEPKLDSRWFAPVNLEDGSPAECVLTNKGCAFEPRVLIVRTTHTLVLANADPTMHNVNIDFVRNPGVNVVVEPDGRREIQLKKAEPKPVAVRCNVHTFMNGWVVVRDDDYATATGSDGRFRLPALPPGEWRLAFWHEGQPLAGLAVGDGVTDKRGRLLVEITDSGPLDLGEIAISADSLRP